MKWKEINGQEYKLQKEKENNKAIQNTNEKQTVQKAHKGKIKVSQLWLIYWKEEPANSSEREHQEEDFLSEMNHIC